MKEHQRLGTASMMTRETKEGIETYRKEERNQQDKMIDDIIDRTTNCL